MPHKVCIKCGEDKPLSNFHKDKTRKNGHSLICKECKRIYFRKYSLKKRYGITPDEYATLIGKQEDKCACCADPLGDNLVVDHNHETGEVRGILCHHCNVMLGYSLDNPVRLEKGVRYLLDKGHYG